MAGAARDGRDALIQWLDAKLAGRLGEPTLSTQTSEFRTGRVSVVLGAAVTTRLLIDAAIGLLGPQHGTVLVDGLDPFAEPRAVRRRLCVVAPQQPVRAHLPTLQVVKFLVELGGGRRLSRREILTALRLSDLPDECMTARASTLTPFQRLCIWLAVHRLRHTSGLIVDQPAGDIVSDRSSETACLLQEAADDGAAVVIITDNEAFARRLDGDMFRIDHDRLVPHETRER